MVSRLCLVIEKYMNKNETKKKQALRESPKIFDKTE